MKYLFAPFLLMLLSCSKDSEPEPKPKAIPPEVTNVEIMPVDISGTMRPKFVFTVEVPEPDAVRDFAFYAVADFPFIAKKIIPNPVSGLYEIIDSTVLYTPPAPIKYIAFFGMKDGRFIDNTNIELK